eukprot:Phypoly_transcript_02050.p1 GENE.Phypoly_transcript_02050~~Phypoly_transcript_02050.p1  ORF type:complete len:789 (+),score=103.44 Phypoly_transcript_02050:501-2867(+)
MMPIPFNPTTRFFNKSEIVDVGELMLASFSLNGSSFTNTIQESTWWMGEKYDGVRCCWNSKRSKFYSRHGRELTLSSNIKKLLPSFFLDGELWCGRGLFNLAFMLCNGLAEYGAWNILRFIVFDVPSYEFRDLPFENRYYRVMEKIQPDNPFSIVAARALCIDGTHLGAATQGVIETRGEGMILRKMHSLYLPGRNPDLIKFKDAFGDREGLVVQIDDGIFHIMLLGGQVFTVPESSIKTEPLPACGDVVTFSYEIRSRKELPENPVISRIRLDISWEEVLANYSEDLFAEEFAENREFATHSKGYWTRANMRSFLESFAKKLNLNPLRADSWYKIPSKFLYKFKNGRTIMQKFGGYAMTLLSLFPDIGLDPNLLPESWRKTHKRRRFFEIFAEKNDFDPLVPENWYSQAKSKILSEEGAHTVLFYHFGSVSRALVDLFPEIGLQRSGFSHKGIWTAAERRQFFIDFAKKYKFDPFKAENWYSQSRDRFLSIEGARTVLSYHKGNASTALMDLFPELGIKKRVTFFHGASRNAAERRKAFENFAKRHEFDPLNPEKWSEKSHVIRTSKDVRAILAFFHDNVAKALMSIFPEVAWEKSLYYQRVFIRGLWKNASHRRRFFLNFAKANKFDPQDPTNWRLHLKKLKLSKHAMNVLAYHGNSATKALSDLFPELSWDSLASRQVFNGTWQIETQRRRFFENFALEHRFDPLVAESWYLKTRKVLAAKNSQKVLSYHGNSVTQALQDLFPDVSWESSKYYQKMFFRDTSWHDSIYEQFMESVDAQSSKKLYS